MRLLAFILFLLGLLVTGVLGTETALLLYWPGCLLLGLAGLVAGLRWKMRITFAPNDWCLASVGLLTLYLVARAWWSPVAVYAREDVFIVLGCFVAYVLSCTVASHPRWRLAILVLLVLLVVGNLVVGFVHLSGNWAYHIVPHFQRTFEAGRIGGFFNNANHLAAFLSLVMFLGAGQMLFGRGGASTKLLFAFLCVAASIGIALTKSRGALMGLGAGVLVFSVVSLWVLWRTHRHLFGRILLGYVVMLALAGSVLFVVNAESQKRREASSPMANDVRLQVWQSVLAEHKLQPVIGMGARSFYDYCITLRPADMPVYQGDALFAHNEYLQMLADYGWIGLLLAFAVIGLHMAHGMRFVRWFAEHKFLHTGLLGSSTLAFATGALAALVATLVHAVFEFHFHVAATAITAAVVMGLLANPGFDAEVTRRWRLPGVRPVCKLLLVVASGAMLAGAVRWAPVDWYLVEAKRAEAQRDMQARQEALDKAIARDPANAEAWYLRGLAHIDQWKPTLPPAVAQRILARAADDLNEALKLNPQHYVYATALTDVNDRLGNEAAGLAAAQQAVRVAPLHEEARLALALHFHRWGHFDEAERAYRSAQSAGQRNKDNEFGWNDGYQQLLKDKAAKASQPK